MKESIQLFGCGFSTSIITDKIAAKIATMKIKEYFEYVATTKGSFSQITLD